MSVLSVVCEYQEHGQEHSYCPMVLRPILNKLDADYLQTRVSRDTLTVTLAGAPVSRSPAAIMAILLQCLPRQLS